MAHERQLIEKGSKIRIIVSNRNDLLASSKQSKNSTSSESKKISSASEEIETGATIKLQVMASGSKKYKDLEFDLTSNPFSMPSV